MSRTVTFDSPHNFYITVLPSGKEGKVTLLRESPDGVEAKRVSGLAVKNELSRAARWQAQVDITKAEMLDRKFFSPSQTEAEPARA